MFLFIQNIPATRLGHLLEPLAVAGGQGFLARGGLLDRRAGSDGILPLKEACEFRVRFLGDGLVVVVLVQKEEAAQEGGNVQIGKSKLLTQEEGTVGIRLESVSTQQELVELLQFHDQLLAVLGSLGGVQGEGGLVMSGLGAGTPVVDQVAGLSSLKSILGQKTRFGVQVGDVFGDKERLQNDVFVIDLEGRDLSVGVDVVQVPLRTRNGQIDGHDLVFLLGLGKSNDGSGGVRAEVGVVENELWDGHVGGKCVYDRVERGGE